MTTHVPTPLGFHTIRGKNVVLEQNGRVARRRGSFSDAIVFSNRPIDVSERVYIKLSEVSTEWSGVLRFGITNIDPDTYRNNPLPRFVAPDLTAKGGVWVKSLPEKYSAEGTILRFHVNCAGEMYYGINGSQKGILRSKINTNQPMWLIFDIYGNSVALEILGGGSEPTTSISSRNSNESSSTQLNPRNVHSLSIPVRPSRETSKNTNTTILPRADLDSMMRSARKRFHERFFPSVTSQRPQITSIVEARESEAISDQPSSSSSFASRQILIPHRRVKTTLSNVSKENAPDKKCILCVDAKIDAVVYKCGHMCMCYACAYKLTLTSSKPCCPICRAAIVDVIRVFQSW